MRLHVVMRYIGATSKPKDDFGIFNKIFPILGVVVDKQILTIPMEVEA